MCEPRHRCGSENRARRSGQDEQEAASAADHCVAISIAQLQPRFGVQTGDSPKDEIQKINATKGRRVNVGQARKRRGGCFQKTETN
jgi:hypothetical protein